MKCPACGKELVVSKQDTDYECFFCNCKFYKDKDGDLQLEDLKQQLLSSYLE